MKFLKAIWDWFKGNARDSSPPVYEVPALPPETDIEWDFEEVEYQRLPELPVSKGRKAKIEAIVWHYTAGWQNQKAKDAIEYMQANGHGYLFIDGWATLWQHIHLDEVYAHAGQSVMPSFSPLKGRSNVSSFSIGIEVANGGRVDANNKTWFGKKVEADQIRTVSASTYGKSGRFEKFTPEQEATLINTTVDLCRRYKLNPLNVVSHHEISPSRRDDISGALSMTMHEARALIAKKLKEG